MVAVDADIIENTADPWYRRRVEEIANGRRFTDWRLVDGQLYYLRQKPVVSDVVEDLDRWK